MRRLILIALVFLVFCQEGIFFTSPVLKRTSFCGSFSKFQNISELAQPISFRSKSLPNKKEVQPTLTVKPSSIDPHGQNVLVSWSGIDYSIGDYVAVW